MASPVLPRMRDFRSEAQSFKRDRDAAEKWSLGQRRMPGVPLPALAEPLEAHPAPMGGKVRPGKAESWRWGLKNTANITPKPNMGRGYLSHDNAGTALRRVYARMEAADGGMSMPLSPHVRRPRNPNFRPPLRHYDAPLSRSLYDLLPCSDGRRPTVHGGNIRLIADPVPRATTSMEEDDFACDVASVPASPATAVSPDVGIFYSFERQEAPGGPIDLGDLVDRAEQRWEGRRTEKLVRGEWEVLDEKGDRMRLPGRGRPKGRAGRKGAEGSAHRSRDGASGGGDAGDLDMSTPVEDGFELI